MNFSINVHGTCASIAEKLMEGCLKKSRRKFVRKFILEFSVNTSTISKGIPPGFSSKALPEKCHEVLSKNSWEILNKLLEDFSRNTWRNPKAFLKKSWRNCWKSSCRSARGISKELLALPEVFLENPWRNVQNSLGKNNHGEILDECPGNCREDFKEHSCKNWQKKPQKIPGSSWRNGWWNPGGLLRITSKEILEEFPWKS